MVAEAVGAGVSLVQLREKDLSARELVELGTRLLRPVRAAEAALVVNDRIDVALALGAEGVHLGAGSIPVAQARRLIGESGFVGMSVHSLDEAVRAERDGADYLVLGTIFDSRSHPGVHGAGPDLVRRVTSAVRIPVLAIGGITASNAGSVMEVGASGVAVITAIQSAPDVARATRALLEAIKPRPTGRRTQDSGLR
ncbi:MAG TPA: thiamine phosphate synthase, partial [Chloroflexota bacterium]